MTTPAHARHGGRGGPEAPAARHGWAACVPELAAAAFLVLGSCTVLYLYAGLGLAVYAAAGWAVLCIVALPLLIPSAPAELARMESWHGQGRTSFLGFWRKRSLLQEASASMAVYDAELRPALQHLLAARLAERHDVSLYADPAAARRLLDAGSHGQSLWTWLDPQRPAVTDQRRDGIPPRTLTAIIDRLERL
jgi:hypothetical protein